MAPNGSKWLHKAPNGFIYSVDLPWLTLPQVFVHRQDQIAKKNNVCLAKHFTQTNRILHRHPCGACDKFHVGAAADWQDQPGSSLLAENTKGRRKKKPLNL